MRHLQRARALCLLALHLLCVSAGAQTYISQQSHKQGAVTSQNITATGAQSPIDVIGYSTVLVTFRGTYGSAACDFEASPDGANYGFKGYGAQTDGASVATSTGTLTNATRAWVINVSGMQKFRLNCTAIASGTINATITPIASPQSINAQFSSPQLPATLDGSGFLKTHEQGTAAISAASLPLPTGASTETTLAAIKAKTDNLDVLLSTRTKPADQQHAILDSGALTSITNALPAGTNLLGKVGIDQTTPGTTNRVDIGAALPTGANTIGGVNLAQYTPATGRLPVDPSGVTSPVSAASLPLPSGAATSAKQPALGTAGSASADVITIQGIAAMMAVKVDGSGVTQPVSGTVSVNALPAGSNVIGHAIIDSGSTTVVTGNVTVVGAAASGAAKAGNPLQTGGVFNTTQPTVTTGQAVEQQMTARGAEIVATGVDVFNVTVNAALPAGGNTIGAVTQASGPWSVNHTQVNGSAVSTAATGVQKVGIVGNAGASLDAATGAAVPANGILPALRAATANPTNATGGNAVAQMGDKAGRTVVVTGNVRELIAVQQTNVATTSETTIVSATASEFHDISQLIITTAGAAAQTITIKDATAGTTRLVLNYPNAAVAPGAPLVINFNPALVQSGSNANWTVTQSAATACNYTVVFVKNL